jgi:hypothetical protein
MHTNREYHLTKVFIKLASKKHLTMPNIDKHFSYKKSLHKKSISSLIAILMFGIHLQILGGIEDNIPLKDPFPWSVLIYRASTATQVFGDVLLGKYSRFGEDLYVAELAYTLDQKNPLRRIFKPLFDIVQIASNITYRHDYNIHDNVTEGNLYLIWRFSRFPWNYYLKTSVAIGDGVSYASHSPFADRNPGVPESNYSKLLNYLMLETTFAAPHYPAWQLVFRIHHRCTAWGTYPKKASAGSTSVGLGIRYCF